MAAVVSGDMKCRATAFSVPTGAGAAKKRKTESSIPLSASVFLA